MFPISRIVQDCDRNNPAKRPPPPCALGREQAGPLQESDIALTPVFEPSAQLTASVPPLASAPLTHMDVAVIGAGPAGLMAADVLSAAGLRVHVFDRMPSAGRKLLLAGRGGLNLTHSEPEADFLARFAARSHWLSPMLGVFGQQQVRAWAESLGVSTFVGSSGRVFPVDMKAAPLLRAWLHRLRHPGVGKAVVFHHRHVWQGWHADGALRVDSPSARLSLWPRATVLALGGGSWARLGSDGAWVPHLLGQGVSVAPLEPSNCGFDVAGGWTDVFRQKFAGQPLKTIALTLQVDAAAGGEAAAPGATGSPLGLAPSFSRRGECVVTSTGLEGSLVYAASAALRGAIHRGGSARVELDLLPDWSLERVQQAVCAPRGSRSLSSHLKSRLPLDGVRLGLLYECLGKAALQQPALLAHGIKALPVTLSAPRPIDEAISTAGGVRFEAMDASGMLLAKPGVFCAGEMLDWDAPTGGYLLTACLSTGHRAGRSVAHYLGTLASGAKAGGPGLS